MRGKVTEKIAMRCRMADFCQQCSLAIFEHPEMMSLSLCVKVAVWFKSTQMVNVLMMVALSMERD